MAKRGRPTSHKKATVLSWMEANDKGARLASKHFKMSESTIKYWLAQDRKKVQRATLIAAQGSPPPVAPVTKSQMDMVNQAVELRLQELLDAKRIKDEPSSVSIDLILKLRTSFKLGDPATEDDLSDLSNVLRMTAR